MIGLHIHLLPGVDGGARDLAEAELEDRALPLARRVRS